MTNPKISKVSLTTVTHRSNIDNKQPNNEEEKTKTATSAVSLFHSTTASQQQRHSGQPKQNIGTTDQSKLSSVNRRSNLLSLSELSKLASGSINSNTNPHERIGRFGNNSNNMLAKSEFIKTKEEESGLSDRRSLRRYNLSRTEKGQTSLLSDQDAQRSPSPSPPDTTMFGSGIINEENQGSTELTMQGQPQANPATPPKSSDVEGKK